MANAERGNQSRERKRPVNQNRYCLPFTRSVKGKGAVLTLRRRDGSCMIHRNAIAITAVLFALSTHTLAATKFVKPTGTGDCGSWANACTLPTALTAAGSGDELWVKSGTYAPFGLKNGVKIIGGFAGTETLAKNSNPATNVTIIDGGGTTQCLSGEDLAASTVLRGFTIRNGIDGGYDGGGGIVLNNSSALMVQCIFEDNKASFGGAVAVRGSGSPEFINCTFRNNGHTNGTTPLGGGAVFVYSGSPIFTNCLFFGNKAGEGGAVLVAYGTPTFINCTFAGNAAVIGSGGGVFDREGQATLKNCILWGNTTTRSVAYSAQIHAVGGSSLARYSNIQGGWPGTNILNTDPLFVNSASSDYRLQATSPCKDVGENASLWPDHGDLNWNLDTGEPTPKDLAPKGRTWGPAVDIGAYELHMVDE